MYWISFMYEIYIFFRDITVALLTVLSQVRVRYVLIKKVTEKARFSGTSKILKQYRIKYRISCPLHFIWRNYSNYHEVSAKIRTAALISRIDTGVRYYIQISFPYNANKWIVLLILHHQRRKQTSPYIDPPKD